MTFEEVMDLKEGKEEFIAETRGISSDPEEEKE
jgi:hypothetical protein